MSSIPPRPPGSPKKKNHSLKKLNVKSPARSVSPKAGPSPKASSSPKAAANSNKAMETLDDFAHIGFRLSPRGDHQPSHFTRPDAFPKQSPLSKEQRRAKKLKRDPTGLYDFDSDSSWNPNASQLNKRFSAAMKSNRSVGKGGASGAGMMSTGGGVLRSALHGAENYQLQNSGGSLARVMDEGTLDGLQSAKEKLERIQADLANEANKSGEIDEALRRNASLIDKIGEIEQAVGPLLGGGKKKSISAAGEKSALALESGASEVTFGSGASAGTTGTGSMQGASALSLLSANPTSQVQSLRVSAANAEGGPNGVQSGLSAGNMVSRTSGVTSSMSAAENAALGKKLESLHAAATNYLLDARKALNEHEGDDHGLGANTSDDWRRATVAVLESLVESLRTLDRKASQLYDVDGASGKYMAASTPHVPGGSSSEDELYDKKPPASKTRSSTLQRLSEAQKKLYGAIDDLENPPDHADYPNATGAPEDQGTIDPASARRPSAWMDALKEEMFGTAAAAEKTKGAEVASRSSGSRTKAAANKLKNYVFDKTRLPVDSPNYRVWDHSWSTSTGIPTSQYPRQMRMKKMGVCLLLLLVLLYAAPVCWIVTQRLLAKHSTEAVKLKMITC